MKTNNIFKKFLLAGGVALALGLTSCEDFLTVLPTDQNTEDDFWKDKNDLDNVRSAAYLQMTKSDITGRILYWGELRSDNFTQNDMSQSHITYLQQAILQPTQGMFKWSNFYTGINYCNKVLEKGEQMTVPGNEVDPSFRQSDWLPIKAEMHALRGLYYFYLVRAFRDVPYVTKSISTDAEAKESKIGATPGAMILADICDSLELAKTYGAEQYTSTSDTKGRFTKRSIHALLADIYLWRGCMLRKAVEKGDAIVNANGDTLSQIELDRQMLQCFEKAIENCDYVLAQIQKDYDEDQLLNPTLEEDPNQNKNYPYLGYYSDKVSQYIYDNVYGEIFGSKNSDYEGVFELQYDGDVNGNSAIASYLGKYESGSLKPSAMIGASMLTSSALSSISPERGFGKTDFRLIQTYNYSTTTSTQMYHKNIVKSLTITDRKDVTKTTVNGSSYRTTANMDANWPVYRLADVMLIKAEAIARRYILDPMSPNVQASTDKENKKGYAVNEGFKLVNALFCRSNPALKASGVEQEFIHERCREDYATRSGNIKNATQLLTLVYNERQREFIGEGKRWFDIVRQAEFTNNPTDVLTSFISVPTTVKNRLKQLYSLYVPIHNDEIKINGVEYGGKLVQNPVWDRYTTK